MSEHINNQTQRKETLKRLIRKLHEGKTVEDAVNNLKEATELYLEEFPSKEGKKTFLTTFEVVQVAKT